MDLGPETVQDMTTTPMKQHLRPGGQDGRIAARLLPTALANTELGTSLTLLWRLP